jgi:hypothetical protein
MYVKMALALALIEARYFVSGNYDLLSSELNLFAQQ